MSNRKSHPGHIEKRAGSYRLHLCVAGQRHKYTLACSRKNAERFAREEYRRLELQADRRKMGLPGALRFSALLDRYERETLPMLSENSQRSYGYSLAPIRLFFATNLGDPTLDRIHAAHIQAFLDWRRVHRPDGSQAFRPLSNRSLQKERAILHRIFAIADRLELREGNPVSRTENPRITSRNPVILSHEEYERLLAECEHDPMLWLYALVLGETGARSESEATWFRWEDVKLDEGFIWINSSYQHRTKSGKGRWVPMTRRLARAMREHFARFRFSTYRGNRSNWVFHHVRDRRNAVAGDRIGSLRISFRSACKRARLPDGFVKHDLRHRRVTTWLADEKNPVHVKEALGHAQLATTMEYTHLAKEHLRSLVDGPIEKGALAQ